ncbi:MAG: pectate lyase [Prevotella sp.]|nr:pectate lyase [Prevotella sp.]
MKLKHLFALCAMAVATTVMAQDKLPAFPGAEGFGRYTTGGRGGNVYTVTNLNDSGQGSLRWALSQPGPRTIVFNVDGTIHLQSSLNIPSNTTIAGQTAPGMGICVADFPFSLKGSNIIVRYMRIRLGNTNVQIDEADGWDGFGGYEGRDIIIDHCSVSWSIDECLSVYGNINTTVQWCIAAQSLVNSGHSKGAHGYGAIWGGSGASFHHNLLAHHSSRVPRLGARPATQTDERVDMRNNVFYNWGGEGSYGYEGMNVNIVNNYFKPGPGTTSSMSEQKIRRIAAIGIRTNDYVASNPSFAEMLHVWGKYYISGNNNSAYSDVNTKNWELGVYNQINANGCDGTYTQATKDSIKLSQPIPFVHTTTHTAKEAYNHVVAYAGACKGGQWDALDQQFIKDTKGGIATSTGSGLSRGFINTQNDNVYILDQFGTAWPTLTEGEKWTDTDGDGMPDEWEAANGLNPNDPADGKQASAEGYTNLEVYMNSLVADITAACTDATVLGQEDVPASALDSQPSTLNNYYVIQNADEHVGAGKSITEVDGITATFSSEITDWKIGGSKSDAREVDGVPLSGKYAQSNATNGAPVIFTTTKAGTLTIFLGGDVAITKKVVMTDEEDNGLTGTILSDGRQIPSNTNPTTVISAWDGIVYQLEANKTYTFKCTGTKWRLAGFRHITGPVTQITLPQQTVQSVRKVYNLHGQEVSTPQPGSIYIIGRRKVLIP